MLLQELHIEGFRSLKSVTWKPGRLNVLIGPNGGGKSNLLGALQLIRLSTLGKLRETILSQGGMQSVAWNGKAPIIFDFQTAPENGRTLTYDFRLQRLGKSGSYVVSYEKLVASDGSATIHRPVPNDNPSETLLSEFRAVGKDPIASFRNFIKNWSIHQDMRTDQSAEIRNAAVTRFEEHLEPEGRNLTPVLHTLYEGNRDFEELIDNAMLAAFPNDYEKLKFPAAANGRVQLELRRKSGRVDTTTDLSDGTLRFLILLAALGSPDPAPLIAIDEPETGLHPRMLPIIAAVAANAALKTQVILTTHSPRLLDAFSEDLPATTVVTWNSSATDMRTIGGADLKYWVENYSLGKFAFSGEAETVL